MNTYLYRILLPNGRVRRGMVRLSVVHDHSARLWLERHFDAVVLQLYRLPKLLTAPGQMLARLGLRQLSQEELSGLLRDLGVMTRAGISLMDALRSIIEDNDTHNRRVASVARMLFAELDAGASVTQAFGRFPDLFPETVRSLLLIGEETGTLDKMLLEAAQHVERLTTLGRDLRRAMIYPMFVFATIIGAAAFWLYYVIPNLAELFLQMRLELPWVTRQLLAFSGWAEQHILSTLLALVLVVAAISLAVRMSRRVRNLTYTLGHRLPVFRTILVTSGMAFITEYMALMIRSGINILSSLDIMERSLGDEYYRTRIRRINRRLERGERLGASFRQVGGFPPMAVRMINLGEESGSLDTQLQHLASEYRGRLRHLIETISEVIKPLVILLAGAFFLLLVVALLLPIYELVGQAMAGPMGS